ncbi:MAG: hypothetical protein KKC14_10265 [Alphaproteobacteria bacterium]|nr:hypothetical protein [Alphaproteobacteria bacterium]
MELSTSEAAENTLEPLPDFSSADIVKLYAATFLPLCEMLADSGVASHARIARTISGHVPPADNGAWAQLARALVGVLERAPPRGETASLSQAEAEAEARLALAPRPATRLSLVPGGRS